MAHVLKDWQGWTRSFLSRGTGDERIARRCFSYALAIRDHRELETVRI
jgi:hypothetical protein